MMYLLAFCHHAKNQKLIMTGFWENTQTPQFLTLNPQIKIFFSKFEPYHLSLLYWIPTSSKVSEKTNDNYYGFDLVNPGVQNEWSLIYRKMDRQKIKGMWVITEYPDLKNICFEFCGCSHQIWCQTKKIYWPVSKLSKFRTIELTIILDDFRWSSKITGG